jgi:hypothetical protein
MNPLLPNEVTLGARVDALRNELAHRPNTTTDVNDDSSFENVKCFFAFFFAATLHRGSHSMV